MELSSTGPYRSKDKCKLDKNRQVWKAKLDKFGEGQCGKQDTKSLEEAYNHKLFIILLSPVQITR